MEDPATDPVVDFCIYLLYEYYTSNVRHLHQPTFEEDMMEEVRELAVATLETPVDDAILREAFDVFSVMYPCRTSRFALPVCGDEFASTMQRLREQPKHAQRTPEWYDTRHNLITASSANKMFGSPCEQNSLIVEKCAPEKERPPLSIYDARHWGVRYEPVSTSYYTATRDTVVEEFGCLVHPTLPFLGASPDGINVKTGCEVYGRMLEIKNPVSRVITGEPTLEYWIQMQLQMEVCDINACDFLETRFIEYATYESFCADGVSFNLSAEGKPKGVMILFIQEGAFAYEYAPYAAAEDVVVEWEAAQREVPGREFVKLIYWRLEEASCVLVHRNREWVRAHQESMASFWETIRTERATGQWTQRLPAKKVATW